jgi:acetylornithine deacetylase/succinyl-diaminopimelate desuccinylase-like protein
VAASTAGTNTNVVRGKVVFKLDRRHDPGRDTREEVRGRSVRQVITECARPRARHPRCEIKRLAAPANSLMHHAGPAHAGAGDAEAWQGAVRRRRLPAMGTRCTTDARLYGEAACRGVLYGAGPRTCWESNAKRPDETCSSRTCGAHKVVAPRTLPRPPALRLIALLTRPLRRGR